MTAELAQLQRDLARQEIDITHLQGDQAKMDVRFTEKLAVLSTRVGVFSALGSLIGGAIVAVVAKKLGV